MINYKFVYKREMEDLPDVGNPPPPPPHTRTLYALSDIMSTTPCLITAYI